MSFDSQAEARYYSKKRKELYPNCHRDCDMNVDLEMEHDEECIKDLGGISMNDLSFKEKLQEIKNKEETKFLLIVLAIVSSVYLFNNNYSDITFLVLLLGIPVLTLIWFVNKVCDTWIKVHQK